MRKLRLLILSDIHFGALANCATFAVNPSQVKHPIVNAIPMRESLITTVKSQDDSIDAILAPGDLTSAGDPAEFHFCIRAIEEIAHELKVPRDHVYYTFGNHDVNWDICGLKSACDDSTYYQKVAAHVGSLFAPSGTPTCTGPVPGSAVYKNVSFVVLALNSGYFSIKDQSYYHGKVGLDQLRWFKSACETHLSEETWNLLLLHHHPQNFAYPTVAADISTLEEGAELLDAAGSAPYLDMILHGHRHHPRIATSHNAAWHSPITTLSAGSVAVNPQHRSNGEIDNLFHIVTLETRLPTGAASGYVETLHYKSASGWKTVQYMDEMPVDGIQHFGSTATEAERIAQAVQLLRELTGKTSGKPAQLPNRAELPSDLRCAQLRQLHSILSKAASEANCQIMGRYPDAVIAMALQPVEAGGEAL